MGEANISTERAQAGQAARFPAPHVDQSRAVHHQGPPSQGPAASVRLTWRIRDRATFAALRRSPRARCGPLTVSFRQDSSAAPPRIAYAIGRKVGGAVERNRLRRRLRAIVWQLAPQLLPGAYLIGVSPEVANLSVGELRTTVTRAMEKVGGMGSTSARDGARAEARA
jgi:ribonuclease P protein component